MRILLALFLTTLAVPAVAGPQRGGRDHENIVRVRIERNIEQLRADVVELDRLMGLPPNRTNLRTMWELQMQIQQGIDRLDALANHIEMDPDEVCRDVRPPVVVAPPPPPPRGPVPMGPERYRSLHQALAAESFSKSKMRVLETATQGQHFTVEQVIGLMEPFTYDKDKVKVATMLYPRCVNQGDWYKVYAALTYDSSKRALKDATR